ncbi:MAG: TolB family protein, partial [Bacteroidales bacterium]
RQQPIGEPELWVVPAAGGEARKVAIHLPQLYKLNQLTVNPDGRRIAFTAGQDKSEIWVLDNFLPPAKPAK